MITESIDFLDGEIAVEVETPSTIADFTPLGLSEQDVIDEAVGNLRYRNFYPRVYKKASKELESASPKVVKDTKTLKDGTVKNVHESDIDHLRSIYKTQPEVVRATVTKHAQAELLYVKGERSGSFGKIGKQFLDTANTVFALGDEKVEDVVSKIEAKVPGYKVGRDADGNPTVESLARGLTTLSKSIEAQAKKDALAVAA